MVHAIKRQLRAFGVPEQASVDAKLIAVHALPIHDVARAIFGDAHQLPSGITHIQVVAIDKRHGAALLAPVRRLRFFRAILAPLYIFGAEVHQYSLLGGLHQHERFAAVGHRHATERTKFLAQFAPLTHLVEREQRFLLGGVHIHERVKRVGGVHQLVAPPVECAVLWTHLTVILAAEIQIFKRELLLRHRRRGAHNKHHRKNNV